MDSGMNDRFPDDPPNIGIPEEDTERAGDDRFGQTHQRTDADSRERKTAMMMSPKSDKK